MASSFLETDGKVFFIASLKSSIVIIGRSSLSQTRYNANIEASQTSIAISAPENPSRAGSEEIYQS